MKSLYAAYEFGQIEPSLRHFAAGFRQIEVWACICEASAFLGIAATLGNNRRPVRYHCCDIPIAARGENTGGSQKGPDHILKRDQPSRKRTSTEVRNIWFRAREAGKLQKQQLGKAQKAEILTLAKTGIAALVGEATGYQNVRPQNALQEYLAHIIRKELAAWVKNFPDEFYENIYKLKGWRWPGRRSA